MTDPTDLEAKIEERVKALLDMCTTAKELTPAVKVAVEFYEAKKRGSQADGWGGELRKDTKE